LVEGDIDNAEVMGTEYGYRPFIAPRLGVVTCLSDAKFVRIERQVLEQTILEVPQLNYILRKFRVSHNEPNIDWLLGNVDIN
jgi:hypothetical protein